ncbi:MAG: DUF3828 domain-containing protein [Rhodospirillaceae bacterium]|nr:DUF3828 domain-containing protein [Rhodospirillaceae bacterium]
MFAISRRSLSLLAIALQVLAACAGTAAVDSPQDFLRALYARYDGMGPGAGIDYAQPAERQRYFTPEMVALIEADAARAAAAEEVPVLNGDPFVGSQDWDISNVTIAIAKSDDPDRTTAVVRFLNYSEANEFRLDLARVSGAWRIADIDWGYDRLSAVLAQP